MTSSAQSYDWDFAFPVYNTPIKYTHSINSVLTTTGATISVVNFSNAKPVDQKIQVSVRKAQSLVSAAIARLQKNLVSGNRPSIKINVRQFNEPSSEDVFWIRASQSDQLG